MTLVDRNGRAFGRFNLIDTALIVFLLLLLPIGYATFLLFRPSRPVIDAVTQVPVSNEERRVSGAVVLIAKFKIKGNGFNPMLRAKVGDTPAVGFVFESPNSADVIVGVIPPGKHDLVLMDGVQEVARAREAVEIRATEGPSIRAFGWLTRLSETTAATLDSGYASDQNSPGSFRIIAAGPVQPARSRLAIGSRAIDIAAPGLFERGAELLMRCDWPSSRGCSVNGEPLDSQPPVAIVLAGGLRFEVEAIDSPADAVPAVAVLRLERPLAAARAGDRDVNVSAHGAELTNVAGTVVTLKLGVRDSRDGWSYRGQPITPGAAFTLRTDSYVLNGTIEDLRVSQP